MVLITHFANTDVSYWTSNVCSCHDHETNIYPGKSIASSSSLSDCPKPLK